MTGLFVTALSGGVNVSTSGMNQEIVMACLDLCASLLCLIQAALHLRGLRTLISRCRVGHSHLHSQIFTTLLLNILIKSLAFFPSLHRRSLEPNLVSQGARVHRRAVISFFTSAFRSFLKHHVLLFWRVCYSDSWHSLGSCFFAYRLDSENPKF